MVQTKKASLFPRVDFVTILIILFFLALTFGVYLYYKYRINEIQTQLKQSGISMANRPATEADE
jgi:hypothetical protein